MSNRVINDDLQETISQEEARYVRIDKVKFPGCNVTEGKVYEVKRDYSHNHPDFEFVNGEMYIVDDLGKDNYSVFLVCKTTLLK